MLRRLLVTMAAAFLLGACDEPKPAASPPPPPPPAPQTFMVFFDWDSTKLSDASMNVISQAAGSYKSKGSARVTATGHTDTSGTEAYNMALSLRRANAVKDALVREGVPATAISVVGRGEQGLLVPTGDGVREPQNRRVEIAIATASGAPMMSDAEYCRILAQRWRDYDRTGAQGPAPQAIAKCDAGNYAEGIPTLQRLLTDARVPYPPRS
jgi:hypothetical protein